MATLQGNKIESGYFGEVPTSQTKDNPLVKLGILDKPTPELTGLNKVFARQEQEKTSQNEGISGLTNETTEALEKRGENVNEIYNKFAEKNQEGANEIKTAFETEGLGAAFEASMKKQLNTIGSVWQLVGQGAGAASDVIWETLENTTQKAIPEEAEQALQGVVEGIADTETVQNLAESYAGFRERNPETARNLEATVNIGGLLGDAAGIKLGAGELVNLGSKGKSIAKDVIDTGIEKAKTGVDDIADKFKPKDKTLENLGLTTQKGKINGIEVDVPAVNRTISDKVVKATTGVTNKQLAGKAVSPRTVGKNSKQKLKSIADVEKNTKKFYDNVRTGVLTGDIDTLENSAQTIVNNLDTVGSKIGEAVKKVDGVIDIDNNLTDDILNALDTKGAEVSPATPILKKFYDSLGDGKLNIADSFELKKAYANEVTKLFKAGDAGTKQYKALSDGVKFLNTKIDDIVETKLGTEFAGDKALYKDLKTLVDDMVASSLVAGRSSANTLAERIGMIESIFSPVTSVKSKLIKSVDELNTRGGAWKELIKRYDEDAVKNFNN